MAQDPPAPAWYPRTRVLVCGGRHYADYAQVCAVLDQVHRDKGIARLIHGGATGADALAGRWAVANKIWQVVYPARWDLHGKAAGPIRNTKMLDEGAPDCVISFPGGRGTADMVTQATDRGLLCLRVGV